jgi:hypothetical protein
MGWMKLSQDRLHGLPPDSTKLRDVDQLNKYQVLKMGSFYEEFVLYKQYEIS